MRQKNLIGQIINLVNNEQVIEPFKPNDFPFLIKSPSFLSKHAVGNGKYSEYFIRITRGLYKLNKEHTKHNNQ